MQVCDYGDKAGNPCVRNAVWVITLTGTGKQMYSCHGHVAALLLQAHEYRRLTQDDPEFTVRRRE